MNEGRTRFPLVQRWTWVHQVTCFSHASPSAPCTCQPMLKPVKE